MQNSDRSSHSKHMQIVIARPLGRGNLNPSMKILFFALVILNILTALSLAKYSGGTGDPNTPYLIATPNDLNSIGLDSNDWDKHFLMTADIDMSNITGDQYNIIGDYPNFTGVFDGNNHSIVDFTSGISSSGGSLIRIVDNNSAIVKNVIMVNAEVNEPGDSYVACLVGWLKAGQISNCHVINGKINAENFSGLLVGINESQIINCSSTGIVSGMDHLGGLVGENKTNGSVINCYSDVNVTGLRESIGGLAGRNKGYIQNCLSSGGTIQTLISKYAGGLVGYNTSGQIFSCFADNEVLGSSSIGGLVGGNDFGSTIRNCYSLSSVKANDKVGGLAGGNLGDIVNCYAVGVVDGNVSTGAFIGYDSTTNLAKCFWNREVNPDINGIGNTSDPNVIGLLTELMKQESTFVDAGWDFNTPVWKMCDIPDYPKLAWQKDLRCMICYVDANADGTNDGSSWPDAYNFLQDGLDNARADSNIGHVYVAQGTYTPDTNTVEPSGTGDRKASFALINNVGLYGGFPTGGSDFNNRNIELYETILSGDLLGNDTEDIGLDILFDDPNRAENSYHVFYHPNDLNLNSSAILDGFTINGGHANYYSMLQIPYNSGGGMYNQYCSPTVNNCSFNYNSSSYGGGLYNEKSDQMLLVNCNFNKNISGSGGAIYNTDCNATLMDSTFANNLATYGAACYNKSGGNLVITNCTFKDNLADHGYGGAIYSGKYTIKISDCNFLDNSARYGGGVYNVNTDFHITNCAFKNNHAPYGGSMCNRYESPSIINCKFICNTAYRGGGIFNIYTDPNITNCIFGGNSAGYGGGIYNLYSNSNMNNCTFSSNLADTYGGGIYSSMSQFKLINCILWNNSATSDGNQIYEYNNNLVVANYSNIQGGWPGIGNINIDPLFVDLDANDFHLKSSGWRYDKDSQFWTWDSVTSRCIDAGSPGSPLGDEPMNLVPDDPCNTWGKNLRINMGAYGGTTEASMAPHGWALLCDVDNNGKVNLTDFAYMCMAFTEEDEPFADFNRDVVMDMLDAALLTEDWLKTTSWH